MKKRYKYKVNLAEPSADRIERHKNFDALMQAHQEAAPRGGRTTGAIVRFLVPLTAVAAAITFLLLVYTPDSRPSHRQIMQRERAYFAAQPYVNPPLPKLAPAYHSHRVSGTEGGIIEYENGSRIVVPNNAFQHADGSTVSGDVTIAYREMHDYVDFFLSGIPMYYDSANVRYQLESAGMIEIYAEQNGRKVKLHPDKNLDIELVSQVKTASLEVPPAYNIYKLNEEERNWEYRERDNIRFLEKDTQAQMLLNTDPLTYYHNKKAAALEQLSDERTLTHQRIEAEFPLPSAPAKPTLGSRGNLHTFSLNDLDNSIDWASLIRQSEGGTSHVVTPTMIERYKSSLWQISPDADISVRLLSEIDWENPLLRRIHGQTYQLTVHKDGAKLSLKVYRLLSPAEYEEASAAYAQEKQQYDKALQDRNQTIAQRTAEADADYDHQRSEIIAEYDAQIAAVEQGLAEPASALKVSRRVVNQFSISELGIWNCDRPILPQPRHVQASFAWEGFESGTGYVVDKNLNTVYQFYAYDGCTIPQFTNDEDQLLWVINDDQQLALYRPASSDAIAEGEEVTMGLEMEPHRRPLQSEADVRRVLSL